MSQAQLLNISWSVFKDKSQTSGLTVYFHEDKAGAEMGTVFCGNRDYILIARVVEDTWNDFDAAYPTGTRVDVSRRDDAIAQIIAPSNELPEQPIDASGRPYSVFWPTSGSRKTLITPNWADPTTWYQKATRVVDEVATGGLTVYSVTNTNLIDVYHGKITGEDYLLDDSSNSFRVIVKVNDSEKTEQDPEIGSGGDYIIDYSAGTVTFLTPLLVGDEVKVTYHYAGDSTFIIKPAAGKHLNIKDVEVQFSSDIVLTDTVIFQAYGLVEVFAPQLTPDPYPAGTLIPLGNPTVYKTMSDYINEANGALPQLPVMGGAGWRGTPQAINIFPWRYQAMTALSATAGMEIRISLKNDVPFTGAMATATFYCLSEDE